MDNCGQKEKEMKTLKFTNPVFNFGLNVTVRRGDKWLDVCIPETVMVADTKRGDIGEVLVVGKMFIQLNLIPAPILSLEHDPRCRDREGLLAEMQETYEGLQPDEKVTVLLFDPR